MKTIKLAILAIGFALLASCNKAGTPGYMKVRMTDAPGEYDKVFVEIVGVDIHYSDADSSESNWVSLKTNAGIYDLLTLQNDITTVLSDKGEIPAGKINQFRLILGTKNSVVVDGISFPLKTPSAQNSGLKLNANVLVIAGKTYEILLDFDAAKSIVSESIGSYSLKPVVSIKSVVEL